MTKREKFIQLISYGPGKLPISFVLESFDMVEAEYAGIYESVPPVSSSNAHTPVPDVPVNPTPTNIMGDTKRGVELDPAMGEDSDQENADALARLRAVTQADRKGEKRR